MSIGFFLLISLISTESAARLLKRFCNMFFESSTARWAVLQLPCCLGKQGELSENSLFYNLTADSVFVFVLPHFPLLD